jgi:hypothetical protein
LATTKFGEVAKGQLNPTSKVIEYLFNHKGNFIEQNRYEPSVELEIKTKYKYDENGLLVERYSYYSNGEEFAGDFYFYDTLGNRVKIKEKEYPGFNSYCWRYYSYDQNHNITELRFINPKGGMDLTETLINRHGYSYDKKGNQIEDKWYNSDHSLHSVRTNNYNSKNLKIESTLFLVSENKIVNKEEFKYNEKNDIVESNNTYVDENTYNTKYEYKYDERNNWIEKIEFSNGEADRITERIFTYY